MNQMNQTNDNQVNQQPGAPAFPPPACFPPVPGYRECNWGEGERVKTLTAGRMSGLLLLLLLLLCSLSIETVFKSRLGIGAVIQFAAYTIVLFWWMRRGKTKLNWRAALLSLPMGLLCMSFGLYSGSPARLLSLPAVLLLGAVQIVYLPRPDKKALFDFSNLRELLTVTLCKPFRYFEVTFTPLSGSRKHRRSSPVLLYLLFGVLLAVPLLLLFLYLFSAADTLFASITAEVWRWARQHLLSVFSNLVIGALLTLFVMPLFIVTKARMNNPPQRKQQPPSLNTIVLSTALILLLLLVLLFSAIQFRFLFLPDTLGLADYASYARSGFFQMTWACALLFVVVAFVLKLGRKRKNQLHAAVAVPAFLLCCCNLLILASAALRMSAYIEAAGLSQKRILTLWLMAVLAFSTLVVMVKTFWLPLRAVRWVGIISVCAVCALSLVNIDRIVAEDHLGHSSEQIDTFYLSRLSCSAAPAVAQAYQAAEDPVIREELGEVLNQYRNRFRRQNAVFSYTLDQRDIEQALSISQEPYLPE